MSAADQPWWASEGELDPEVDPLDAHRAARRGDDTHGEADPADPARPADPAGDTGDAGDAGDEATDGAQAGHQADVCGVCPICTGARILGEARPELLEHLGEAARHLAAAMRAMADAVGDHAEHRQRDADTGDRVDDARRSDTGPDPGRPRRVRRIELD